MKIDDLNDEMLQEILCRLPCYRTARRCKSVSKRWNSVISDPLFITQGFLTHREIKEEKPFSVFLLNMRMLDWRLLTAMIAPSRLQTMADLREASKGGRPKILKYLVKIFQLLRRSPVLLAPLLSLEFLPHEPTPTATTFKDLLLSYDVYRSTGLHVYICNPLTKQWMVLPPCQVVEKHEDVIWTALTYQDGHGFRVVVAHSKPKAPFSTDPFVMINLLIYISETCEWRNIHVRLQFKPSQLELYLYNDNRDSFNSYLQGVVCEGLVCIHYAGHFGAFNPFDVTDTCHGTLTLTAIDLPSPAGTVRVLLESDGKLVAFEAVRKIYSDISLDFRCQGNLALSAETRMWKLDMRRLDNEKQLPEWEVLLQLNDRIDIKGSMLTVAESARYNRYCFGIVGVHPSKEHLVYLANFEGRSLFRSAQFHSNHQSWLILLDTKSKSLEHLTKTIPSHDYPLVFEPLKLDIPSWPTPIPLP